MREPKVYGSTVMLSMVGTVFAVVVASSKQEAATLCGVTLDEFNKGHGAVTHDKDEVEWAQSEPGSVFYRKDTWGVKLADSQFERWDPEIQQRTAAIRQQAVDKRRADRERLEASRRRDEEQRREIRDREDARRELRRQKDNAARALLEEHAAELAGAGITDVTTDGDGNVKIPAQALVAALMWVEA